MHMGQNSSFTLKNDALSTVHRNVSSIFPQKGKLNSRNHYKRKKKEGKKYTAEIYTHISLLAPPSPSLLNHLTLFKH